MELVSILSTIILVGTVITFLLSIGAYIVYKFRQKREGNITKVVIPEYEEAELLTPVRIDTPVQTPQIQRNRLPENETSSYTGAFQRYNLTKSNIQKPNWK